MKSRHHPSLYLLTCRLLRRRRRSSSAVKDFACVCGLCDKMTTPFQNVERRPRRAGTRSTHIHTRKPRKNENRGF